jgi:hypothetical protein
MGHQAAQMQFNVKEAVGGWGKGEMDNTNTKTLKTMEAKVTVTAGK